MVLADAVFQRSEPETAWDCDKSCFQVAPDKRQNIIGCQPMVIIPTSVGELLAYVQGYVAKHIPKVKRVSLESRFVNSPDRFCGLFLLQKSRR